MKECKQLSQRSDMTKLDNLEISKNKRCTNNHSNGNSNENFYQQKLQTKSLNLDNGRKIWCNYHSNGSHSNDECHHQNIYGKRKESSTADSIIAKHMKR